MMGNIDGIEREDWGGGGDRATDPAQSVTVHYQEESAKDHQASEIANAGRDSSSIIRQDWSRDESGRFISKSDEALRAEWQREGGFEFNRDRVLAVEAMMVSAAPTLQNHMEKLPTDIQRKAADVLRLATAYGPLGGVLKAEQFLDSLSASEFESFTTWWRGLSRGDQDAILAGISR